MCQMSSHFKLSCFRSRLLAVILLVAFLVSFVSFTGLAQQPTATISALSGTVLVSGQAARTGTVLRSGDTIQTQAAASVVLMLSDGSEIRLGDQTQNNIAGMTGFSSVGAECL